jgi:hypothetical protein
VALFLQRCKSTLLLLRALYGWHYSRVKILTNVFKAKKWGKNLFPLLCAQKRREFSTSMEINSQQDNNSPQLKLPLLLA